MRELRQVFGYALALLVLIGVVKFSLDAIALEAAEYIPAQQGSRAASVERSEASPAAAIRDPNAQPVWIAATPKYQYDPKLMEVKPRHQLQKEAELRRKQELAKYQAKRPPHVADIARKAMASVEAPSPPAFLMFSAQ